jgi:hypothetical protein
VRFSDFQAITGTFAKRAKIKGAQHQLDGQQSAVFEPL